MTAARFAAEQPFRQCTATRTHKPIKRIKKRYEISICTGGLHHLNRSLVIYEMILWPMLEALSFGEDVETAR